MSKSSTKRGGANPFASVRIACAERQEADLKACASLLQLVGRVAVAGELKLVGGTPTIIVTDSADHARYTTMRVVSIRKPGEAVECGVRLEGFDYGVPVVYVAAEYVINRLDNVGTGLFLRGLEGGVEAAGVHIHAEGVMKSHR